MQKVIVEDDGMAIFKGAIKSAQTQAMYEFQLNKFLKETKLNNPKELLKLGKTNPERLTQIIIDLLAKYKERVKKNEISPSTVQSLYKPVKLYCTMNDIILNWGKLYKLLPAASNGDDRAITREEIKKLLQYAGIEMKAVILIFASSGVRVGAFEEMKIKHLDPIDQKGNVVAAKLTIYPKSEEEYYTFISPEAYEAVQEHINYRKRMGENITSETRLFASNRDTLRMSMHRLLQKAGLRGEKHGKRYEFPANHAFRKFYKTRAEQVMKPINVETLLGHSTGVAGKYYKPSEKELLEDYLKAIPLLSITQQIEQSDRDKEFQKMKEQFEEFKAGMDLIRPILSQLAKEAKTKEFTFTSPDGKQVYKLTTEQIAKLIEGKE